MGNFEAEKFGEEVRKQQGQAGGERSMKNLVFNPETGEFEMVSKTEAVDPNKVQVSFSGEGFA